MRRFWLLLVAAVVLSAGSVSAQPARASANQPAKAARAKPPAAKPSAPAPRTVKPAARVDTKAPAKVDPKAAAKVDINAPAKVDPKAIAKKLEAQAESTTYLGAAITMSDSMMPSDDVVVPLPDKVSASELMTQYQRVGRALMLLARERGLDTDLRAEAAKTSCADLQASFRLIKISEAVATPEMRVATAVLLAQLNAKIERLRGIALSKECLNNPLAKDCL